MNLKVYLAARYSSKEQMKVYAEELRAEGIEVTARWLEEKYSPNTGMNEVPYNELVMFARTDLQDVEDADVLVFFAEDPENQPVRGGRHVEFGYALALGKQILVIGPVENIFHNLPEIPHYENFEQVKNALKAIDIT